MEQTLMATSADEPIHAILARMVKRSGMSRDEIADRLNVHVRTLSFWLEGSDGNGMDKKKGRPCPTEILPKLCTILNDYDVLDALEHAANRLAFVKPHV